MATRRSEVEWQRLFSKYERSGLSATRFCAAEGLPAGYFRKKYRERSQDPGQAAFTAVRVPSSIPGAGVRVQIGEVSIRCGSSVPAGWLAEVVQALR